MDAASRIAKIEEWLHLQKYLHGLSFRILVDKEKEDGFIIEFASASERQLATLRHKLVDSLMSHIRCRAIEIIKYEQKHKKVKK